MPGEAERKRRRRERGVYTYMFMVETIHVCDSCPRDIVAVLRDAQQASTQVDGGLHEYDSPLQGEGSCSRHGDESCRERVARRRLVGADGVYMGQCIAWLPMTRVR